MKKLKFDIDFSDVGIKGRSAGGNLVSKFSVRKVEMKEAGVMVEVETVAVVQVNLILLFPLLHQQQEQLTQVVVVVEW